MILCDFGCDKEAHYKLKNGKNCCSKYISQCLVIRKKNSTNNKNRKVEKPIYKNEIGKCKYCMNEAHFYFEKSNKWCCKEFYTQCPELRKKNTSIKGRKLHLRSNDHSKKLSESNKGKKQRIESLKKRSKSMSLWWKNHPDKIQEQREWLKAGWAIHMIKGIKNPSKQESKLIEIVKVIYPNYEPQYQVLNYSLDIALPQYKIAIEYDGWYHFDSKESIERHNRRQNEIENKGWNFIRYNIFQKFPDEKQLFYDISKTIEKSINNPI